MPCPEGGATHIRENGKKKGSKITSALPVLVACARQLIDTYETTRGYSDEVKADCLKMYVNGSGFRAIERGKGVHHTTVIYWVKQVAARLPDAYTPDTVPQVASSLAS